MMFLFQNRVIFRFQLLFFQGVWFLHLMASHRGLLVKQGLAKAHKSLDKRLRNWLVVEPTHLKIFPK